jgi:Peptidase of plants and bacteria
MSQCSLMKILYGLLSFFVAVSIGGDGVAEVEVTSELSQDGSYFRFENVPLPAIDDAGSKGKWTVIAGQMDANSGSIECLFDGRVPTAADQPSENFFFAAVTPNGLIALDLDKVTEVAEIVSYSWHADSRAPQFFAVYAATGDEPGFAFPDSIDGISKTPCWKKIASANSGQANQSGGQHAVRISDPDATLGNFRHLLFEMNATEPGNRFSHTFFSEIDVIVDDARKVQRIPAPEVREIKFSTTDDEYRFTIDVTQVKEIETWAAEELKPLIQEWYPKIVAMLPSDGFKAARHVRFRFLRDEEMKGIPAYALGPTISMNAEWFRGQLNGEARGAIVHEMVHVVQGYPSRNPRAPKVVAPPGWIVEGIPDYIRWFLFEPETGGAKLSAQSLRDAKHDASYRTSANFIDWVIRNHASDDRFLERLNAAAREGRYSGETWKELTGKSEQELAGSWRKGP